MKWWGRNSKNTIQGFTIVELLIVIVVIAILAAITIVSYNGIQNRAYDTTVQSDLNTLMKKAGLFHAEEGRYPTSVNEIIGFKASKSAYATTPATEFNLTTCFQTNGSNFAAIALSKSGKKYYFVSTSGSILEQTSTGWYPNSGSACTSIITPGANYNGYSSVDTSTGPWRAWAGGN